MRTTTAYPCLVSLGDTTSAGSSVSAVPQAAALSGSRSSGLRANGSSACLDGVSEPRP